MGTIFSSLVALIIAMTIGLYLFSSELSRINFKIKTGKQIILNEKVYKCYEKKIEE